ncbi:hypothetical protein OSB04_001493 [Centaurea solstitialis]|uniref:Uncharacterized protein n=1 Tax=Centaurea solstitialis TaxID=347529 RepID=A0AA38U998_9ASTR|nr:hypothetical protein OSB04_001493 [Centaurea solstitialis]
MLISGPKSPGKCLNVFMRPLIDELKVLWETGFRTWDRYGEEYFTMKAAVMWTISDFPGLGMLGGIQTKGYKACPICLDDTDAKFSHGRMLYMGARRWLDMNHEFRVQGRNFNGNDEFRPAPQTRTAIQVYKEIVSHRYPRLSLIKEKKSSQGINESKLCWTHKSIFWELPYWKKSRVRHALDVMHIEKNVCDNILGTILGFDGKSKDDLKARKTLEDMKIRKHLWPKKPRGTSGKPTLPYANYTVKPQFRLEVLDQIVAVQYPSGYAGSLKNKVNINDKKFYGLKTHDCHALLQRILPWSYDHTWLIMSLMRFAIFPPAFFTIMVHLCIHLPEQVSLTGLVHYTWMFPIERQLGEYKKHVTNTRYPEGCIAERYLMHECVTFMNLYLNNRHVVHSNPLMSDSSRWSLSVVSDYVIPSSRLWNASLTRVEMETARWMMADEQRSVPQELEILSRGPQQIIMYQQCNVNGVRFVCEQRDESRKTQNSGVMIVADGVSYYGVLLQVVELNYPEAMPVVLFKCRWYDEENTKLDRSLISIDTKTDCYKDSQFCLALHAKQVFYVDDPVFGNGWKVVHHMFHRGTYKASTLARNIDIGPQYEVEEPYQEPATTTIPICQIFIDLGPTPRIDIPNDDDEKDEDYDEDEDEDDDEEEDENEVFGINDDTDSDNNVNEFHNTNDEYRHDPNY